MNSSSEGWHRLKAPAGTRALLLPKGDLVEMGYLNGREANIVGGRIAYPDCLFVPLPYLRSRLRKEKTDESAWVRE
jgi:hypothetical protein